MPPITRKRVLLVEDEEATYKVLTVVFEEGGFEVFHTMAGGKALDIAAQEKPDIVLLDLVLPGFSGLDVLANLKNNPRTHDIPVLILSQLSDQDSISRGIALGAMGYLVKSEYQLEDILKKVKEILK
ncbi:MAG: response regulator [bacterium]|nr:response regulator [bacterium]